MIENIVSEAAKRRELVMKKKVIAVLLTVAMVLGLVACGNSGSSNSDSSSAESTSAEESTSTEESTSALTAKMMKKRLRFKYLSQQVLTML